jgi:hypothetical protein
MASPDLVFNPFDRDHYRDPYPVEIDTLRVMLRGFRNPGYSKMPIRI